MASHKSITKLLKQNKPRGLLSAVAVAVVIAVVTVGRLVFTYDDFRSEIFEAWEWILALVGLNVLVIGVVLAVLVKVLKPQNWIAYALVVILSFPAIVATPIAVSAITGTDVPGQPESVKLSEIYSPWEDWLRDEIEEPVKAARTDEIRALVNRYETRGKAGKRELIDRLDQSLSDEGLSEEELGAVVDEVKLTIDQTGIRYSRRLRQVARMLYAEGHRSAVKDLGRIG